MSVGADGTVRIMWGDDRLALINPGGKLFDIFIAEPTDKGASFSPNFRVTTTSSNPDFDGLRRHLHRPLLRTVRLGGPGPGRHAELPLGNLRGRVPGALPLGSQRQRQRWHP